jgi:hypothetical protein
MRRHWALEIDSLGLNNDQAIDEYLWKEMFPRITYDVDRYDAIRKLNTINIEAMLAEFNAAWDIYLDAAGLAPSWTDAIPGGLYNGLRPILFEQYDKAYPFIKSLPFMLFEHRWRKYFTHL